MCYINAVLQSLSGIALFAQMMRVARLQLSMKGNSIFTALGRLLQEMGMRPQSRVALPLDSQPVKLAIGLKWPQFRTPDQQVGSHWQSGSKPVPALVLLPSIVLSASADC